MVIKYVWQRYVMEAEHLTNLIPNITSPNSELNKGPLSPGQITWIHHCKSLVPVFFSALKNSFKIGTYRRINLPIPIYTDISAIGWYEPIISVSWGIGRALPLNYYCNVKWCTQFVHSNLYFSYFYIFSKLCGISQSVTIYIVSQSIVIYRMMTHVSCCVPYHEVLANTHPYFSDTF